MAKLIIYNKRGKGKQRSQTLFRGLKILESIAGGNTSLSVRELAQHMNLPRSVVHRLILTLEDEGYLKKNTIHAGYTLGTKLWSLGSAAIQNLEIRDVARGYLENLAVKTNELVALAVLDGDEVVYIDKIDSSQTIRAYIPIGGRAPAYCISTGKAILAYRSGEEVSKIVSSMKRFTNKTVVNGDTLKRHLAEIRRRGYSVNSGEWHEDVAGVASPIQNREGNVTVAIGVTVPIHRLTKETIDQLGRLTIAAASGISNELGYNASKKKSLLRESN
jgi:IclR family KDG regulon transcriptional repressor